MTYKVQRFSSFCDYGMPLETIGIRQHSFIDDLQQMNVGEICMCPWRVFEFMEIFGTFIYLDL